MSHFKTLPRDVGPASVGKAGEVSDNHITLLVVAPDESTAEREFLKQLEEEGIKSGK